MSKRTVRCAKFGEELPGLEKPPLKGPLGELVYNNVSERAWLLWKNDMQIKVLNEYRLNMADKNDYNSLMKQMLRFLNLEEGQVAEVENADRGKGQ